MVFSPAGLKPERDCAGCPSSRQRGRHIITNLQLSKKNFKEKEKLVTGSDCALTGAWG
jgi:hypothetical protein